MIDLWLIYGDDNDDDEDDDADDDYSFWLIFDQI